MPASPKVNDLLSRIDDAAIREELAREFAALASPKLGISFERHLPETVELPGVEPRRGLLARHRSGGSRLLRIGRVADGTASCATERAPGDSSDWRSETLEVPVGDLEVIARFGDSITPGLRLGETMLGVGADVDDGAPAHLLLNSENVHALQALAWTHTGKVDLIYIDPPYNTGNKTWTYNDDYVSDADEFRSSKWLSFMDRRLRLAKQLLSPTGVIIAAIGDDEHHRLRMLMDDVFGVGNFISDVTWQGPGSSQARSTTGGLDYMLIYGRDKEAHFRDIGRWRDPKIGGPEMLALVDAARKRGDTPKQAQQELRAWLKAHDHVSKSARAYNQVDDRWRLFTTTNLDNGLLRPNLRYPITDPATGRVYEPPTKGWKLSRETMAQWIEDGLIHFGGGTLPTKKVTLHDHLDSLPDQFFSQARSAATKHLEQVLGDKRFPFPKDHSVLARWIGLTTGHRKNAVVLDFFGGSGSTLEAVLRLNAADGGERQCILITNNELAASDADQLRAAGHAPGDQEWEALGVYNHVTRPRVRTVLTGFRDDGSDYSDGLPGRVQCAELVYLDRDKVSLGRAKQDLATFLWLRAGGRGPIATIDNNRGWSTTSSYGIVSDTSKVGELVDALPDTATTVYVITNSTAGFEHVASLLPAGVAPIHLYEQFLDTFTVQIGA